MPKLKNQSSALNALRDELREMLADADLKEHRTICKRFYVTEAEEKQLESMRQGVNLSTFVRAKVFGTSVPRPRQTIPQINREAYIHLANLRSNCNQIAKAVNTAAKQGQELPLTQAYLEELKRLEILLVEIGLQLNQATDTSRGEARE